MHRGMSALLAVVLAGQLCSLVTGRIRPGQAALPPWHLRPRMEVMVTVARDDNPGEERPGASKAGDKAAPAPLPEITVFPDLALPGLPPPARPAIRGVYATAYSIGSARKFAEIVTFIRRTEVNAIVIDVKDDSGTISYPSSVPLARALNAGQARFSPEAVLSALAREDIYPIARIVAFKDPFLAARRTDLAVRSKSGGGLWRDQRGQAWADPYNREVWRYIVDVAKEAAAKGFREIQFDYVRFTSDGQLSDCIYPSADGRGKAEVIRDFLIYARRELKPLGVEISADVFGLTCSARDDLGIGQRIEEVATAVDIISPMVYPSHYARGSYGISDPDLAPYDTILASLRAAVPRLVGLGVRLRPWLQDFSLRHKYGRAQLMAQIKAVYDAGLTEWIFWNPSNTYDPEKYNH